MGSPGGDEQVIDGARHRSQVCSVRVDQFAQYPLRERFGRALFSKELQYRIWRLWAKGFKNPRQYQQAIFRCDIGELPQGADIATRDWNGQGTHGIGSDEHHWRLRNDAPAGWRDLNGAPLRITEIDIVGVAMP